jgi:caffeoyl-CoA O-methyltransferase
MVHFDVIAPALNINDPAIQDYVLAHCTPADDVLRDLADETEREFAKYAVMRLTEDEGALLTILTRLVGAKQAVEVGTFTGYSAICIARALPPDGKLLACDISEEWTDVARRYWERAGVADRIDLRLGPAVDTLKALPKEETIDIAFIDADKSGYATYYEEILTRMRPGGVIVLDNVLWFGRVVDPACQDPDDVAVREINDLVAADPRVESVMLPLRDGVTIARKK